jgi:putative ABC transport system permease protein
MRDWERYVRTHLLLPPLTRERESRIVQELASQFEDFYREAVARGMTEFDGDRRQQTTLLVVFGAMALVIASLGLYGLLAQTVSARGREIGIRIALGATWRTVVQMVMSRGIALTSVGVGIGAVLAWSVTRAMDTLLYDVGPSDPLTFALVVGLLAGVSAIACAIPAMRAARVDPMLVLRDQ